MGRYVILVAALFFEEGMPRGNGKAARGVRRGRLWSDIMPWQRWSRLVLSDLPQPQMLPRHLR